MIETGSTLGLLNPIWSKAYLIYTDSYCVIIKNITLKHCVARFSVLKQVLLTVISRQAELTAKPCDIPCYHVLDRRLCTMLTHHAADARSRN